LDEEWWTRSYRHRATDVETTITVKLRIRRRRDLADLL
jgi:hypothetical protein